MNMAVALKPACFAYGGIAQAGWYGIKHITTNPIGTNVIDEVLQATGQMAERRMARLVDANCMLRANKRIHRGYHHE